jgi:beta-N-acetylhexosaminidase
MKHLPGPIRSLALPLLALGLFTGAGARAAGETAPAPAARENAPRERAEAVVREMEDSALAAQVIMGGIDGNTRLRENMRPLLERIPLGAYMLFRYNLGGEKEAVRSFLAGCVALTMAAAGKGPAVPPFVAADHEGGLVHRFGPGVERLPPPLSYWEGAGSAGREAALRAVEEDALRSGREIRGLGVNLNLAPVAELLSPENRPFLESRSYGPDGEFTEAAAAAFVRGMRAAGVACAAKHFPGNTGADPHTGRTVLGADRESLDRMAAPFAGLIRREAPSFMMVSHALIPARDGERNASLSPRVMGDWLRGELGFRGVILADDFSMAAVAGRGIGPGDAAVEALAAGADMVMVWPADLAGVHRSILAALEAGRLGRERLRDAAARIVAEKIRFGLMETGGEER